MRIVKVHLSIGFARARHSDELEFDDDVTEDEIDEAVKDWAYNYIDYGWTDA